MAARKRLPVGVDLFETLIRQDYYYLDKTAFISHLLNGRGYVNLFTRPRRFGKTLNMSMLKSFFEIGSDKTLFSGMEIEKETEFKAQAPCKSSMTRLKEAARRMRRR